MSIVNSIELARPSAATIPKTRTFAYMALAAAGTFWGFGFVFGKYALAEMPVPAHIVFRFLAASLVLVPVLIWRRTRVDPKTLAMLAVAGLLYIPIQFLIQFEGLARTSVSHASLMVALIPALLALAGTMLRRADRGPNWIAVAASVLGAALIVARTGGTSSVAGDTLVLVSLLVAVAWILLTERYLAGLDVVAASAYMLWLGTIALVAYELLAHPHELVRAYGLVPWSATIASGIFSTAASTLLWNFGLRSVPSADAGVFINLEPLVGAIAGVALFGDAVSWQLIAGGTVIVGSAIAIARSSSNDVLS
jgi:drug/metabolite transporter (DMT)-like permease